MNSYNDYNGNEEKKRERKEKNTQRESTTMDGAVFFQLDNNTLRVQWNDSFKLHSYGRSLMEFPMPGQ
jgi:hypothetical protein